MVGRQGHIETSRPREEVNKELAAARRAAVAAFAAARKESNDAAGLGADVAVRGRELKRRREADGNDGESGVVSKLYAEVQDLRQEVAVLRDMVGAVSGEKEKEVDELEAVVVGECGVSALHYPITEALLVSARSGGRGCVGKDSEGARTLGASWHARRPGSNAGRSSAVVAASGVAQSCVARDVALHADDRRLSRPEDGGEEGSEPVGVRCDLHSDVRGGTRGGGVRGPRSGGGHGDQHCRRDGF